MATAEGTTTATGIDAVYYLTQDLARARRFYESVLGVRPSLETTGEGGSFVEYEFADGATFGLAHLPDTPWHESGGTMFAVPDVKAAMERAKAAGASVHSDLMETPVCHMAWLRDAEGNSFCLHHRKAS